MSNTPINNLSVPAALYTAFSPTGPAGYTSIPTAQSTGPMAHVLAYAGNVPNGQPLISTFSPRHDENHSARLELIRDLTHKLGPGFEKVLYGRIGEDCTMDVDEATLLPCSFIWYHIVGEDPAARSSWVKSRTIRPFVVKKQALLSINSSSSRAFMMSTFKAFNMRRKAALFVQLGMQVDVVMPSSARYTVDLMLIPPYYTRESMKLRKELNIPMLPVT